MRLDYKQAMCVCLCLTRSSTGTSTTPRSVYRSTLPPAHEWMNHDEVMAELWAAAVRGVRVVCVVEGLRAARHKQTCCFRFGSARRTQFKTVLVLVLARSECVCVCATSAIGLFLPIIAAIRSSFSLRGLCAHSRTRAWTEGNIAHALRPRRGDAQPSRAGKSPDVS